MTGFHLIRGRPIVAILGCRQAALNQEWLDCSQEMLWRYFYAQQPVVCQHDTIKPSRDLLAATGLYSIR